MDLIQTAKTDSYGRIGNFNQAHAAEVAAIPGYATEQQIFNDAVAAINAAGGNQSADNTGLALDSEAAKLDMAKTTVKYALRGAVQAKRAGNNALYQQLAHGKTYISHARNQEALQRSTDIRNTLNSNLNICTNVTPANIAEIDAKNAAFSAVKDQPKGAIETKKASGTDVLPGYFKTADDAVDNMYDLLSSYLEESHPELVTEFHLIMRLAHTGVHHTGIRASIVSSAAANNRSVALPLENITMKIVERNRTAVSNINGMAQIERVMPGTYHVEFSGNGFATKALTVPFTRGHFLDLSVALDPSN